MRPFTYRLLLALEGGLFAGFGTSYLPNALPEFDNVAGNSGAIWGLIAFGLALGLGSTRAIAITAGLVALGGEVIGYYAIAGPVRGFSSTVSERWLWTVAALIVGPLVGLAAWMCRQGRPLERALAIGALCGLVIGEGVHRLDRLSISDTGGWVAVVVGLLALAATMTRLPRGAGDRLAAGAGAFVLTVLTFAVYGQPIWR